MDFLLCLQRLRQTDEALLKEANGEMRGSLHCAVPDKTVNRFGRDDGVWVGLEGSDGMVGG